MDERFIDLRDAIQRHAFVRGTEDRPIIESDVTGVRAQWIFDFRALMLQPTWLNRYADIFWEQYANRLPFQVCAMESAGISLVAAIVMKGVERGTPVNGLFIRKSRKRTGLMNRIEGTPTSEPIILVDDLLNTGSTMHKQIDVLAEMGVRVTDIFALLRFRASEAYDSFSKQNVKIHTVFSLPDFGLQLLPTRAPEIPSDQFKVAWRFVAPRPGRHLVVQKSTPAYDGERLYVGHDDGVFRAIDANTGDVVWEFRVGKHPSGKGILSSPALSGGMVYFGAYDGVVYALDTQMGHERWRFDDADWIGSSPAVAEDLGVVFIGLEFGLWKKHGGIAALEAKTGQLLWQQSHPAFTHGSPLYIRKHSLVLIGSNSGFLYAYDARTGVERYRFPTRGDIKTAPAYDTKRDVIVVTSMDGVVYGIRAADGIPLFVKETGAGIYASVCINEDMVYVSSLDKSVYGINLADGSLAFEFETDGRVFSTPVVANTSLFVGSNDGKLYELDARSGMLRSSFQLTERIVNPVVIDTTTRRLFVSTQANELYCLVQTQ